jgi:membrane protein DedA with SNARE-associated domain
MWRRDYIWPVILIVLGVFFLLNNINPHLFDWLQFQYVWPVLLIALGVYLILRRSRT